VNDCQGLECGIVSVLVEHVRQQLTPGVLLRLPAHTTPYYVGNYTFTLIKSHFRRTAVSIQTNLESQLIITCLFCSKRGQAFSTSLRQLTWDMSVHCASNSLNSCTRFSSLDTSSSDTCLQYVQRPFTQQQH
jgi:hypothetical protein